MEVNSGIMRFSIGSTNKIGHFCYKVNKKITIFTPYYTHAREGGLRKQTDKEREEKQTKPKQLY